MSDGWKKNLEKLIVERKKLKEGMKVYWAEWRENPFDTHTSVNLLVESMRISPYYMGHFAALLIVLWVLSKIF